MMTEPIYRRQLSHPSLTIILVQANQLLHFPSSAERQAKKWQLPDLKS